MLFLIELILPLTLETLHMALRRERPAPGLIHHSDWAFNMPVPVLPIGMSCSTLAATPV